MISIPDALEHHDHLLVTGEPGAGKSTMSSYLARSLSRLWLLEDSAISASITEPLVPLRVPAHSLGGSGSWSAVLAEAASRSFGRSLLQDPDPALFADRVQGARWLILVDGLDEIPDPRLRREVIRSVAQRARPGSDYRFVVTTRELPESELAPLRTSNTGSYTIQPFGRPELEEFASRWFTAQQVPCAAAETDRFLRETSDGRLRELVRNPLLATIAAVSAVKEPDKSLPASRISLYDRFCIYLAGDRSGHRNPLAQLRRHYEDDPERLDCVQWLHRSRSEVLSALARRRLESQGTLWQAAVEWTRERAPEDVTLVEGWRDHLWEGLVGTGLLVARGTELRFLHQSFAEFFSAKSHADTVGDDFDEVETWIRRGLQEAERTFALFTFALWAARPGHNMGTVVDQLLSSLDPRRLLLAGRLMAEGVAVPDDVAVRVIDRLFALVRNVGDYDNAAEVFEVLGALFDHPSVSARLDELASDNNVRIFHRVSALGALERLQGDERAKLLLAELLPSVYGKALRQCAQIAVRLGPAAVALTRQRALRMVAEQDSDIWDRTDAAEVMRDLELATDVAEFARSVLQEAGSAPEHLERAAEAWLATCGETAVPEIAALARERPAHDYPGCARLAAVLCKAGDGTAAERLAVTVLDRELADGDAIVSAATTLLTVRGVDAVPTVLLAVDRWSEGDHKQRVWYAAKILKQLAAFPEAAVVLRVGALLERWVPGSTGAHDLIEAWLAAAGAGAAEAVLDAVDQGAAISSFDQAWSAQHLQDAGAHAAATKLAELALRGQHGYRGDYQMAASVLLKTDKVAALPFLTALALAEQHPPSLVLAGVIDALDDTDPDVERTLACIARQLVAHPRIDGDELQDALGVLLCLEGEPMARSVADAAGTRFELAFNQRKQLARTLAAVGQLDLARSVWARLLHWQEYSVTEDVDLVDDFLIAGVQQWAAERMRELIDDSATAPLRVLRLRQMLAWLTVGGVSVGARSG